MKREPTMNDTYIVTVYVMIDDLLKAMRHETDHRAQRSDAEILTMAIVAAQAFQNHLERALCLLERLGYIGRLRISRFNRRLHELVVADKGYISQKDALLCYVHGQVRLVPRYRKNMCGNSAEDKHVQHPPTADRSNGQQPIGENGQPTSPCFHTTTALPSRFWPRFLLWLFIMPSNSNEGKALFIHAPPLK
jgi:hypothetical protein